MSIPEQTMGYPSIPSFGASETIGLCFEGTRDIVLMTFCNVVTKPKIAAVGVVEQSATNNTYEQSPLKSICAIGWNCWRIRGGRF